MYRMTATPALSMAACEPVSLAWLTRVYPCLTCGAHSAAASTKVPPITLIELYGTSAHAWGRWPPPGGLLMSNHRACIGCGVVGGNTYCSSQNSQLYSLLIVMVRHAQVPTSTRITLDLLLHALADAITGTSVLLSALCPYHTYRCDVWEIYLCSRATELCSTVHVSKLERAIPPLDFQSNILTAARYTSPLPPGQGASRHGSICPRAQCPSSHGSMCASGHLLSEKREATKDIQARQNSF
jgi:hypothetical protein